MQISCNNDGDCKLSSNSISSYCCKSNQCVYFDIECKKSECLTNSDCYFPGVSDFCCVSSDKGSVCNYGSECPKSHRALQDTCSNGDHETCRNTDGKLYCCLANLCKRTRNECTSYRKCSTKSDCYVGNFYELSCCSENRCIYGATCASADDQQYRKDREDTDETYNIILAVSVCYIVVGLALYFLMHFKVLCFKKAEPEQNPANSSEMPSSNRELVNNGQAYQDPAQAYGQSSPPNYPQIPVGQPVYYQENPNLGQGQQPYNNNSQLVYPLPSIQGKPEH